MSLIWTGRDRDVYVPKDRAFFSTNPLLLTRTEKFEAWLWGKRWGHALLGWTVCFFPERHEADDLSDVLVFMGIVACGAVALAVGVFLREIGV